MSCLPRTQSDHRRTSGLPSPFPLANPSLIEKRGRRLHPAAAPALPGPPCPASLTTQARDAGRTRTPHHIGGEVGVTRLAGERRRRLALRTTGPFPSLPFCLSLRTPEVEARGASGPRSRLSSLTGRVSFRGPRMSAGDVFGY